MYSLNLLTLLGTASIVQIKLVVKTKVTVGALNT